VKRATNIAEQDGLFIGRAADVASVDAAVRAHRLVTVTGPAGVGKTTLATRCALSVLKANPGGVWLCDLTEARAVEDLCRCVARVLAVPLASSGGADGAVAQLGAALSGRGRVVLLLDNMEQLVEKAPLALTAWLATARKAHFLVTSRERLHLKDEVVVELAPLSVPPHGNEAVELFVERARVSEGTKVREEDRPAIAEIVRQLDGLPLAIELAAARVGVLSPAQLLAHLPRRFELLARGSRDAGARQRTLRGAIAWSWELLCPWERSALAQCAAFHGGFSLEAAQAVVSLEAFPEAPAVLDVLQALREKSLLRTQRVTNEVRYGLYVSIAEFAASMSGRDEVTATAARHATFYTRAAVAWSAEVSREGGGAVMTRVLLELDNMLAAIGRSLDASGDAQAVTQALEALVALDGVFSVQGSLPTFVALLDRALGPPTQDAPLGLPSAPRSYAGLLSDAYRVRGKAHCAQGRTADAERDLRRAIQVASAASDPNREGSARATLGLVHRIVGRTDEAQAEYQRALEQVAPDDFAAVGEVWLKIGNFEYDRGRTDDAKDAYERALPLFVGAGDLRRTGHTLGNLANVTARRGGIDEARTLCLRSIEIAQALADRLAVEVFQGNLAQILQRLGSFAEAHERYERSVTRLRELGHRRAAANILMDWGTLFHEEGRVEEALTRYREAAGVLREIGNRRIEGLAIAYTTTAEVELGRVDGAEAGYAQAEQIFATVDDRMAKTAVLLQRAYFEVLTGRASADDERITAARELPVQSADIRFGLRLIDRALTRSTRELALGPEARWFETPETGRVDLAGRDVLRRILAQLANAREQRPGEPLSSAELIAAGWPGERMLPRAGANRVRVAVFTLRKLGLRSALVSRPDGWMLDPSLRVERAVPKARRAV
jgi:predicted ATPase